MLVSNLLTIKKDSERRVQKGKSKIEGDDLRQERKTVSYPFFDALEMNDRTVLVPPRILSDRRGFPFFQRVFLRLQIFFYSVVEFGIVDDAAYIATAFHFRDHGNLVR